MEFFDKEYQVPQTTSKFMKLEKGDNLIRILAPAVMGWLDWKTEGDGSKKPVRTRYQGEASRPKPINPKSPVKHFWAFPVWDYRAKPIKNEAGEVTGYEGEIKVLEVTQATIHNAIYTYHCDEDYGNPMGYDLKINKTGEKLETTYNIVAKPPKPLDSKIGVLFANTKVDCNLLFEGKDPFDVDGETTESVEETIEDKELDSIFED